MQSEPVPDSKKCLEECFDPHCGEKDEQRTCDGLVSCYWCKKDKHGLLLSNPYCGTSEKCFRGTEAPNNKGKNVSKLSIFGSPYDSIAHLRTKQVSHLLAFPYFPLWPGHIFL